jgi:hypothetical protein
MQFGTLTNENLMLYALKHYDNPQSNSMSEFEQDFKMIPKYLKRLFNKYQEGGDLKERLILNHLIIFYNVFGTEAATRMLFFRTDKLHLPYLKTFLVFLNRCPDVVDGINTHLIALDKKIIDTLRGV